jgi:amino acid adenylation domain-containing protein
MTGDIEPGKPQASERDGDPARRNPRDRHLGGYGPEQGVPAAEGPVSARALHGAARQQARLRAAGQEAGAQEQAEETVPPAFALTPMQQGLLYESAAIGRPWVNLEQIVVHLDGEAPEPEALCRAWQQVCADHAMLRSAILWQGRDTPVQQIHPADEAARMIRVEPRDWQHLEAQAQRRALARFLREDRNRGVALETPLSWRVALMRLGGSRSVMVWTIHHVLVDGRSMSLVLEDLFAHLEGRVAGQALARPDHRRDHRPDHRPDPKQAPKGGQGNGSAPQDAGFHVFASAVAQAAAREETRAFFRTQLAGVEQPNRIAPLSEGFADLQTDPGDIRPVGPIAVGPIAKGRKRQLHHQLSAQLRRDLVARAARAGATLADMIHVAWGVLIARWSGQSRAVFGVTRSGRYLVAGSARMVGCLINTLPLHLRLSDGIGLDDLLGAVRRDTVAMRPHEQASLAEMRQCCDLPADMALFDTMVMFERDSLGARMRGLGGGWATRRVELHEEGAMPLTLAVYGDACPQLVLEYDPEAVPEAQAQRMLGHFCHLLDQLAQAPVGLALSDLDMLPDAERMCLQRWGRPEGARRLARDLAEGPVCMARRLAARAALQPEAPAVVGAWSTPQEGAALSHGQLQARANRLAVQLQLRGAGPGDIIAICLPRSVDFVIAMLAVLKTGAAFLPVDPDYPPAVVAHMLQDSQARLGVAAAGDLPISESDMGEYDPILRNVTWVSPQGTTLKGAHQTDSGPDNQTGNQPGRQTGRNRRAPAPVLPDPDPARLAYVIYTSGSTGKPKGVKVPMRALMAHALAIAAEFDLSDQDRVLQFASLSFDVSIEEILPSLLAGGCVILRDADMLAAPLQFLERVGALKISVLNLPTAFWHMLCDSMAESGHRLPASVRLVIAGGEQVNAQTLARWQAMVPDVRWLNGYGPTETTITCTLFDPGGPVDALQDIPIGRPVAHALAYVLGPDGSLAPAGVAGDLWIGGLAVSDGYIARPETTARSFRPDPRAPVPLLTAGAGPARIYRTGDRAAWREDGTLAFLGRQDRQVKLRGFRIDLRHVEQVLERARPGLRALAAVRGADGPAAQLCCWVQDPAWQGPQVTEADLAPLQAVVQTELPAHMRPALVGVLRFVRTAGGKIDTAALPAPRPARPGPVASGAPGSGLGSDPAAPASALARRIADLMGDVLDQPGLAVDAGFYDQGGHSLLAMRLIGRIEAELGAQLSPVALHQAPSPRLLAALLEGEHSEARRRRSLPGGSHPGTGQGSDQVSGQVSSLGATLPRHLVPIQTGGDLPPLFGVHVLGRNEEFYRPLAATLGPQQPVYGLTVGVLDAETPTGVKITAARYFDEIQTHYPQGVVHLAAVSLGAYFAFELACRLQAAGRSLGMVALFDAEGPGGRCRVQGLGRIRAHLRLMQRMGLGYLGHVAGNRLHGLRRRLMHRHVAQNGAEARLAEGPDSDLSIEALIAANQQSVARYDPAPLPVPLTIFRAGDDLFDSAEGLRQGLGWAPVAGAGFDLIDVPGTHLGILSPPNVEILGRHMAQVLARHDGTDV